MDESQFRQLNWPPRYNYSLQALKESDEEKYNIIAHILKDIAQNDFALSDNALEVHSKYMDYLFRTGLIQPVVSEDDDSYMVYFKMWSLFRGRYVNFNELEPFEQMFLDYYFTRLFDVN